MTVSTKVESALVIGGGIAGPVTALALHRAGIAATVHEAYDTSADGIGGVLMIAPNGLRALGVLGLDETVAAIGDPITNMIMEDGGRGRRLAELRGLADLPPSRTVWRSDLYRVLHDRAVAEGIRIEYGKRLVDVDDGPDGITARFADGTTARADVLIGADGIRSRVRTLIDPAAPGPEQVGLVGLGGFADYDPTDRHNVPLSPEGMHFAFGRTAFFGYWRLPGGGTAWFSNLPDPTPMTAAQARDVPAEDWLRRVRDAHADDRPARDVLAHVSPDQVFSFGSMEIMPSVPHWHRGRMVLVGDSAHAPSSSSGQGASLALESAIELARCLRDLPDPARAFATYQRLRRPRVERIAAQAAKTNNRKANGPVASALFRLLAPVMMRVMTPERMLGPVQRFAIDWNEPVADAGRPLAVTG